MHATHTKIHKSTFKQRNDDDDDEKLWIKVFILRKFILFSLCFFFYSILEQFSCFRTSFSISKKKKINEKYNNNNNKNIAK